MYIRKFTYKKEDLDCKLCTEYRGKKHSCPHDVCPFIAERIEAGAVTYWDAVSALIPAQYRCSRRLPKLADEYPGTFFLDERHRSRMEFLNTQLGYVPGRNTPAYYATMYLLTANEIIHWRMANGFCPNGLDFQYAILRGISTYNYALYRAALALSSDRQGVRGQNQGAKKGRNRSQESRHSCGGYCKGRVRPGQQFTAERADERSTNSMNITYTQNGDYLIPNIVIRKTKPLGHYGRLRKAYLEMHRPILFNELVLSDKLFEHCAEIDEAARNRMELIVPELAKRNGVTEQLKADNQMEWVRQMNACKAQAEEIVKAELIYD